MRLGPTELIILCILGFIFICVVGAILLIITLGKQSKSPNPVNSDLPHTEKTAQTRLLELDDLLKQNIITQEEFYAKRAEIIKQI